MRQPLTPERKQLIQEIRKKVTEMRAYTPKVGIFGNSGVGKSSLCNALCGKKVAIVNDVKACTRKPKEHLLGSENEGIRLVDVPGIGEDPSRQKKYTELYKSLAPEFDLVLWAIKADDRSYASALDSYHEVFSSNETAPPVLFVITQTDKTNDAEDWDYNEFKPSRTQINNIAIKEHDVSRRFGVTTKQIISIAISKQGRAYNLTELVDLVVETLPKSLIGSRPQSRQAVNLFRKAAEQGDASAQNTLGFMYAKGQGVPQDFRQAVNWFRKAAEQGNTSAQNNLDFMYSKGHWHAG